MLAPYCRLSRLLIGWDPITTMFDVSPKYFILARQGLQINDSFLALFRRRCCKTQSLSIRLLLTVEIGQGSVCVLQVRPKYFPREEANRPSIPHFTIVCISLLIEIYTILN